MFQRLRRDPPSATGIGRVFQRRTWSSVKAVGEQALPTIDLVRVARRIVVHGVVLVSDGRDSDAPACPRDGGAPRTKFVVKYDHIRLNPLELPCKYNNGPMPDADLFRAPLLPQESAL